MKEEKFKVLKTMVEARNRMDLNMFAKKLNLAPNQTFQLIQELAKEGFLQKSEKGYGITEKGKAALKAFTPMPEKMNFHFYFGINQPADVTARTMQEFYMDIKQIRADSLEFHLYRGDFENWLKEANKEPELAHKIEVFKVSGFKGEMLRTELLKVFEAKYGFQELS